MSRPWALLSLSLSLSSEQEGMNEVRFKCALHCQSFPLGGLALFFREGRSVEGGEDNESPLVQRWVLAAHGLISVLTQTMNQGQSLVPLHQQAPVHQLRTDPGTDHFSNIQEMVRGIVS